MVKPKIITVTGPTASGKTTLGILLARELGYEFIPEEFEDNPYLERFNKGEGGFLEAELWFIQRDIERYKRALNICNSGKGVILDKPFYQNFAYVLTAPLSSVEREQCMDIIRQAMLELPIPDLLIDITASPELIIERIRSRGREVESGLQLNWFESLRSSHAATLHLWPAMPTFRFDTRTRNFITEPEKITEFIEDILRMTGENLYEEESPLDLDVK